MHRRIALMIVTVAITGLIGVYAQESTNAPQKTEGKFGRIEGTIRSADGSVLPGATVSIKQTQATTVSNEIGRYSLTAVPLGDVIVTSSLPGFAERELPVRVGADPVTLDFTLELKEQAFEIVISANTPKLMSASEGIGVVTVSPREMAALPSLGQKDLFRALQLMPGVSATNESTSGLHVRGGTPDQNLVLFDGFTAYDVDHFFGIFSAFNPDAIESLTLHKGGFESKYGGRLSSVMDVTGQSRMGDQLAFGGGLSFLSYNAYAAAPLGKRGSFLLAARKSYESPFSDRIRDTYSTSSQGPGPAGPAGRAMTTLEPKSTFYDVNARVSFALSRKDALSFTLYQGADDLDSSRSLGLPSRQFANRSISGDITDFTRWGNTGLSAIWERRWADWFSSTFTAAHSRYFKDRERSSKFVTTDTTTNTETSFETGVTEQNPLRDFTARIDNFLSLGRRNHLEFGAEMSTVRVTYGFKTLIGRPPETGATGAEPQELQFDRRDKATQYSAYAQDTWQPSRRFSLTPGLRATYFDSSRRTHLDPRLAATYKVTEQLRFKAAGGRYHQFVRNLVRENVFEGDQDIWTIADGAVVPVGSATHFIAGANYETPKYLWDLEVYRKNLTGLSEIESLNRRRPVNLAFDSLFHSGSGRAEGIEITGQKKAGSNTGWLSYTLGRVRYMFPHFSLTPFPASHDSTHEFKLIDTHQWRRWTFAGTWVYASGKPFTAPGDIETVSLPNGRLFDVVTLGAKNAVRLPSYHRLDLSATFDFLDGESQRANAGVSVFNAYNQGNVWRKQYDAIDGELIETDVRYLGLTVSAFVNFNLSRPASDSRAGPAWSKGDAGKKNRPRPDAERLYDFYGTVESVDETSLVVSTKGGSQRFRMEPRTIPRTIKGSDFGPGDLVHVYYKRDGNQYLVTSVFQKIKSWDEVKSAVN